MLHGRSVKLEDSWGDILGGIESLERLNLSGCNVRGSLPAKWGQSFRFLQWLDLTSLYDKDPEGAIALNLTMPAGGLTVAQLTVAEGGMEMRLEVCLSRLWRSHHHDSCGTSNRGL